MRNPCADTGTVVGRSRLGRPVYPPFRESQLRLFWPTSRLKVATDLLSRVSPLASPAPASAANRFAVGFLKGAIFDTMFAGNDRAYARFCC